MLTDVENGNGKLRIEIDKPQTSDINGKDAQGRPTCEEKDRTEKEIEKCLETTDERTPVKTADEILREIRDTNLKLAFFSGLEYLLISIVSIIILGAAVGIELYLLFALHIPVLLITALFQMIVSFTTVLQPVTKTMKQQFVKLSHSKLFEPMFHSEDGLDLRNKATDMVNLYRYLAGWEQIVHGAQ